MSILGAAANTFRPISIHGNELLLSNNKLYHKSSTSNNVIYWNCMKCDLGTARSNLQHEDVVTLSECADGCILDHRHLLGRRGVANYNRRRHSYRWIYNKWYYKT